MDYSCVVFLYVTVTSSRKIPSRTEPRKTIIAKLRGMWLSWLLWILRPALLRLVRLAWVLWDRFTRRCNHRIRIYTERQKKLITSSERRSLQFTALELIIFGHRKKFHSPYPTHLKHKGLLESKLRKSSKITRAHKKITETTPPGSRVCGQKPMRGYITRFRIWMNSYWMFGISGFSWWFSVIFCECVSFTYQTYLW